MRNPFRSRPQPASTTEKPNMVSDEEFAAMSINEAVDAINEGRLTVSQMSRLYILAQQMGSGGPSQSAGLPAGLPPGAEPYELSEEEKAELRAQGVDPDTVTAVKMPKGYVPNNDDEVVQTANGAVRWGDVPKDENGKPTEEWVNANCTCPEHTAKRAGKKSVGGPNDGGAEYGAGMTGGYL